MKYYKNILNGNVYRTEERTYNNGEKYILLERYSFDFENWQGHIHNHAQTRKNIETLTNIIEIQKPSFK